jgi:hypothetical protein
MAGRLCYVFGSMAWIVALLALIAVAGLALLVVRLTQRTFFD